MQTTVLPSLDELHKQVIELINSDQVGQHRKLAVAFNQCRLSDNSYQGPDPKPVLDAIASRLRKNGVRVHFDTSAVTAIYHDDPAENSYTWGYTDGRTNEIYVRTDSTVRGQVLTLAHEGGHALTKDRPALHMPVFDFVAQFNDSPPANYIVDEAIAEAATYLVGTATGTALELIYHANYIASYLNAFKGAPDELHEEVWRVVTKYSRKAAEVMLGETT